MLQELIDDPFYVEYAMYNECVLDYCIVKSDSETVNHKDVVIFAMNCWNKKYDLDFSVDENKMESKKIDVKDFFNEEYERLFLKPPYMTMYSKKDFNHINELLFPNGTNDLEIYDWNTDWSDYFEEGLEWWGIRLVSILDKSLNRFIVIGASATD